MRLLVLVVGNAVAQVSTPSKALQPSDRDCRGRLISNLINEFEVKGFTIFAPCSFQPDGRGAGAVKEAAAATALMGKRRIYRTASKINPTVSLQGSTEDSSKRLQIHDGEPNMFKKHAAVRDVISDLELLQFLALVNGGRRFSPFQSRNFVLGSMTPPHSDATFVDSAPRRGDMTAVWFALEDVHPHAGPLTFWPGTHKLDRLWDFAAVGLLDYPRDDGKPFDEERRRRFTDAARRAKANLTYPAYSRAMGSIVEQNGWRRVVNKHMRRGEVAVWQASLIHGGSPIVDPNRTRLSMTGHYFSFETAAQQMWYPAASTNGSIDYMLYANRELFQSGKKLQAALGGGLPGGSRVSRGTTKQPPHSRGDQ